MPKVTFLPAGKAVNARVGQTLIQAARLARVVIPQRCGGHASCQMCRIVVEEGQVSPPSVLEQRKMSESQLRQGMRLACQTKVTAQSCTVRIPEDRLKAVVREALERQRQQEDEL